MLANVSSEDTMACDLWIEVHKRDQALEFEDTEKNRIILISLIAIDIFVVIEQCLSLLVSGICRDWVLVVLLLVIFFRLIQNEGPTYWGSEGGPQRGHGYTFYSGLELTRVASFYSRHGGSGGLCGPAPESGNSYTFSFHMWSCSVVSDPMDCSLPGSFVHGIFQARILEWVAISFSRRSSRLRDWTQVSHIVGRCFTIWVTREVTIPCEARTTLLWAEWQESLLYTSSAVK